jgi:hypothetical protein
MPHEESRKENAPKQRRSRPVFRRVEITGGDYSSVAKEFPRQKTMELSRV